MGYELVDAKDVFDDDNDGLIFGINWLDDDGVIVDCEWFATEDERNEVIDRWYAELNNFEPEQ